MKPWVGLELVVQVLAEELVEEEELVPAVVSPVQYISNDYAIREDRDDLP
jgi:hypothetical protein